MKMQYQLRWLPNAHAATALLVAGHQPGEVLRVCAELGLDPLPTIHTVADGFLLLLDEPNETPVAGVQRLRGLSRYLLIPVNAELTPALLPDEAEGMVKLRGMVFLADGRVLDFDCDGAAPLASLLDIAEPRQEPWSALPAPPALADEITEITLLQDDPSADAVLEQGGEGIGEEQPELPEAGLATQLLSNTLFKLGKGLAKLGDSVGSNPLANLGAKMLGAAMSMSPALSEELMGSQEALLRELLRQFREGNIDNALRHAMPLGLDPSRGMTICQNAKLPTHSLYYSLVNLLGNSGGGGTEVWFSRDNTFHELLREYQKQADLAVQRGDFRRAAFIHARLLQDFHSAAKVLSQGGLHRDAAVLYEKKVRDMACAAREWDAAGEHDRAVALYRQLGDHIKAGDILRKIGEEDRAVAEYQIAAARILEQGGGHYDAGELLRVRGQRADLALSYFEQGWEQRPGSGALSCATRLVQHHAEAGTTDAFSKVLSEAETFLTQSDVESTATFFNEIARLARTDGLQKIADEVHDRALMGMAKKVRQCQDASTHPPSTLAGYFKNPTVWPTPFVGDAQHALVEAARQHKAKTSYVTIKAGRSVITAVCQLPMGNAVVLGNEAGEVLYFQPATNEVHVLAREDGPIQSISVDSSRNFVTVLSQTQRDSVCLRVISRASGYRSVDYALHAVTGPARLGTAAINSQTDAVILASGGEMRVLKLPNLMRQSTVALLEEAPDAVVYGTHDGTLATLWMVAFGVQHAATFAAGDEGPRQFACAWTPSLGEHSTLNHATVRAHMIDAATVEIAGLDSQGHLQRVTLNLNDRTSQRFSYYPGSAERYRAFACPRSDLTAGVHIKGIDWWTPSRIKPVQTRLTLRNPVAAFPLSDAREIVIVEADGLLTRVPVAE
jgi:tetratricopeptide (TPR) repeat protein